MTAHPLDPLSPPELELVVRALTQSRGLDHRHLIAMVQLDEPPKVAVLAWRTGDPIDRAARVTVWSRAEGMVSEAVVGVDGSVRSWADVPGALSPVLSTEAEEAMAAARADERVLSGRRARGSDRGAGPVMVFYHGGGFVIGSLYTYEPYCAEVARLLDLPVISIDYRLSPEYRFPAPA